MLHWNIFWNIVLSW